MAMISQVKKTNPAIDGDKPSEESEPSRVNKPSEELIEEHKSIDSNKVEEDNTPREAQEWKYSLIFWL